MRAAFYEVFEENSVPLGKGNLWEDLHVALTLKQSAKECKLQTPAFLLLCNTSHYTLRDLSRIMDLDETFKIWKRLNPRTQKSNSS